MENEEKGELPFLSTGFFCSSEQLMGALSEALLCFFLGSSVVGDPVGCDDSWPVP